MSSDTTTKPKIPDSCCFVIFGITGDLAHRLVTPALYNLAEAGLLPDDFCVVGVTRTEMQSKSLHDDLMKGLLQFATRPIDKGIARKLFDCVTSVHADPHEHGSFDRLKKHLDSITKRGIKNHLFYLAVPPTAFKPISEELGRAGLLHEESGVWL